MILVVSRNNSFDALHAFPVSCLERYEQHGWPWLSVDLKSFACRVSCATIGNAINLASALQPVTTLALPLVMTRGLSIATEVMFTSHSGQHARWPLSSLVSWAMKHAVSRGFFSYCYGWNNGNFFPIISHAFP